MKKGWLTFLLFNFAIVSANQAIFYLSHDEAYSLDIQSPSTVWEIKETLEPFFPYTKKEMLLISDGIFLCEEEFFLPYDGQQVWVTTLDAEQPAFEKAFAGTRDYSHLASHSEQMDLRFIMKTLATKSLAGLLKYRSELEAAGKRIDRLHPLRFLEVTFSSEELKVYIHNIRKRGGWIWSEFIKGIKGSLEEEFNAANLTEEMLQDFSERLDIDVSKIEQSVHEKRWEDFIKTLIVIIPREGDLDRYDQ